jgi:pyruvate ferredoxin oxidoreductase delta subunit
LKNFAKFLKPNWAKKKRIKTFWRLLNHTTKYKNMEKGAVIKHDLEKAPKTGEWRYMTPEVDGQKCIGCATCVPFCPEATIELVKATGEISPNNKKGKIIEIDYEYCKGCGTCAQVCPVKAIIMKRGNGNK